MNYRVEPLSATKHRVDEFFCEEQELTDFFRQRAWLEMKARASVCFVLVPENDPDRIAGFYTLSAATIGLSRLPAEMTAGLPQYPHLPATLLGRLARDQRFRGAGLGDLLLTSALRRALDSTKIIGSVAVVTDPKHAQAAAFYRKYGFHELGAGRRMFVAMTEIAAALENGVT